jgi:ABC-type multidrug transport system ATPase subunit
MEYPILVKEVWKSYGTVQAVRGLSLNVPPQSVFGFLGPNGAGKSTTIRLVLGLQRPDRGEVYLFGRLLARERLAVLRRIGSLVEAPSLYLHLTGRENLEIHRRLLDLQKRTIEEALATVDLASAADRLVRTYSSGMKQRLGLAQALLGNPELLILDEPTNGLDPAGIHEIRELVRGLPARCGVTVFLSSHMLSEVEQVATHLAIISSGELKFQGARDDLRALSRPTILVEVDDTERALALLIGLGFRATRKDGRIEIAPAPPAIDFPDIDAPDINAMLVGEGIRVSHLSLEYRSLEELFLDLTRSSEAREVAV